MQITIVGTGGEAALLAQAAKSLGMLAALYESADDAPNMQSGIAFCAGGNAAQSVETLCVKGYDTAFPGRFLGDAEASGRIDALFSRHQRKAVPVFLERYATHSLNAKRLLDENAIGRPGIADVLVAGPPGVRSTLLPLADGLDLAVSWFGFPVYARGFRAGRDGLDCAAMTAQFEGGVLLNLNSCCGESRAPLMEYEISGSGGNLAYDEAQAIPVRIQPAPPQGYPAFPGSSGTTLFPAAAALKELPGRLKAQEYGIGAEGRRVREIIFRAFSQMGEYRA